MRKSFKSFSEIKKYIRALKLGPAARCCVDLALLDIGSKYFKKPILRKKRQEVHYSAVVSLCSAQKLISKLIKIKLYGFKSVKIKVGVQNYEQRIKLARLVLGRQVKIGIDANGAWSPEQAKSMLKRLEKYDIQFCEQPLSKNMMFKHDIQKFTEIPIMVDESLTTLSDAKKLKSKVKILNIRIAKVGGILAAQDLIEFAKKNNMKYQIGCLVGETGILSAAGRILAMRNPEAIAVEGSYSKFILKSDILKEDINFGFKGRAFALSGYGLGVEVDERHLKSEKALFISQ